MKFDWAVQKLEHRNLVEEARELSERFGRVSMGRSAETWDATLLDMLADRIEELESESKEDKQKRCT